MKRFGARLSAAGWYDFAYNDDSKTNPNLPFTQIPSYINKKYSTYTNRFYQGPSGEFLDAFVFAGFDLWSAPPSVKLGRHTHLLGRVAVRQRQPEQHRLFAEPARFAEGICHARLRGQGTVPPAEPDLCNAADHRRRCRFPPHTCSSGTPSASQKAARSSARLTSSSTVPIDSSCRGALGFAVNGNHSAPIGWATGASAARWSPQWLDGTLGFYYRNYADKLPQTLLTTVGPNKSVYNLIYADNIDPVRHQPGEEHWRRQRRCRAVLSAQHAAEFAGAWHRAGAAIRRRDQGTARRYATRAGQLAGRDSTDAGVRCRHLGRRTDVWRITTKVRSGANLFMAEGYAPCAGKDKWDGCTTRNYAGLALAFTPVWYQVFPGVDLFAPVTYRNWPQRQCPHGIRRQPGPRQLQHRCRCRCVPEIPFRPEVHRLGGPLQGQRHVGHEPERPYDIPEGPRFRQLDVQDNFLRGRPCISQ